MIDERINSLFDKLCKTKEGYYKAFLNERYGMVPEPDNIIQFYKEHKITVNVYSKYGDELFVVREKGHKVFVMHTWDGREGNRFDVFVKVEKFVKRRKKK